MHSGKSIENLREISGAENFVTSGNKSMVEFVKNIEDTFIDRALMNVGETGNLSGISKYGVHVRAVSLHVAGKYCYRQAKKMENEWRKRKRDASKRS